jgi:hypothetical protein
MVKAVQTGQVWRNGARVSRFLVTKVSNELLTRYATLRPANRSAAVAETIPRQTFSRADQGATLPGYTFIQDEF